MVQNYISYTLNIESVCFYNFSIKKVSLTLRISFLILLLNALIFTQVSSAVDNDIKLKSALLKAMKTHDTPTVNAIANGGHESIDRDDVLQEKIYEYLDAEREREIQIKEKAKADAIANKQAQEKAKSDAVAAQKAAEEKAKADVIAKQKAEKKAAATAIAAKEKKKKDAIAAKKAAEKRAKADVIAKQKAAAAAVAATKAAEEKKKKDAIAAKKAKEDKARQAKAAEKKRNDAAAAKKKAAAEKQAKAKKAAAKKTAAPAAPKAKAVPKAVIAAPVVAAPIVAETEAEAEVAPLTVSDKKLIGTWKQISSEKVVTMIIEENTNFSLEQVEDDGTLTITGTWKSEENMFMLSINKVQRNVHSRETDIHRIYKVERLTNHRLVLRDKRNRIAYDLKR